MQILIRPDVSPKQELDLTRRLVSAIADELWRLAGSKHRLDWLEAERHLRRIVGEARSEAGDTAVVCVPTSGGDRADSDPAAVQPAARRRSTGRARPRVDALLSSRLGGQMSRGRPH